MININIICLSSFSFLSYFIKYILKQLKETQHRGAAAYRRRGGGTPT